MRRQRGLPGVGRGSDGWPGVVLGDPRLRRLVAVQVAGAAADAAFTVSLAGSLFFGVSVDAARPRLVAYLMLTLAPFAVLGPIIGPYVDRVRGGYRVVLIVSALGRGLVCAVLAGSLQTVLFFPGAFTVLVLAKTASVAKSALVPRLVDDVHGLVAANAAVSRLSSVGALVGGALGTAMLRTIGAPAAVVTAAVGYATAGLCAARLPRSWLQASSGPRVVEVAQLSGPRLGFAAAAMSLVRFSVGYMTFLVAFMLKASGQPVWVFGAVLVFGVAGGLFGSVLGPWLRGRTSEETLLGGALIGLAAVSVVIAGQGVRSGAVLVAVVFAVAAAVGQQAFLSTAQRLAPHAEMGRAFAWFEARFQIAWVMGALGPVIARPSQSLGFVVLGAGLALGVAGFFTLRGTLTEGTAGGAGALVPDPTTALLALAHALVAQGDHELAVLTATEAVRVAAARTPSGTPLPHELMALWRDVAGGAPATPEIAAQALRVAEHATGINPASRTVTPTEPDRST